MAYTVRGGHIRAVGNGMRALDGAPGIALLRAELLLFLRMPADSGGIKNEAGACQGGKSRALGIPLVPADQRGDAADAGVVSAKTQIARREIKFLVIGGIVGNVHLAVDAGNLAGGIDDGGAIVVEAGCAALEDRSDDDDVLITGDAAKRCGRRPGNWFGEIE